MNLLLDTHALIWFAEGNRRLSEKAKTEIINPGNESYISVASLWEIVIKVSIQKLELKRSFVEINQFLTANKINVIGIEMEHLNALLTLPYHHSDPFDRLIIVQALTKSLVIISADKHFYAYNVSVLW
ncbi:type II toxin-antitoxin system VapC family toxin [soil metagenome]|jgi:PIN domain nuclease of toxin-antitoxin system